MCTAIERRPMRRFDALPIPLRWTLHVAHPLPLRYPAHDPLLRPRPRAHRRAATPRRRSATRSISRSTPSLGLQALLAGRASQHAGHRQRGDRGGDRPCRRRHQDDPRRRRRHHAAEPRAAGDRRAVRHARVALIPAASISASAARPAPTSSPRGRCAATSPTSADEFPAGRARAAWRYFAPTAAGPARSAPCRAPGSNVPLWILGSSLFGAQLAAALGLPFAFASHFAPRLTDAGARHLPRAVPALGAARQALCDGSASTSSPPTPTREAQRLFTSLQQAVRQPAPRHARPAAAAGRATWSAAGRRTSGRCSSRRCSCSAVGSPETVRSGLADVHRTHRRRRADGHGADLRSRGAAALVRDRGRGARSARGMMQTPSIVIASAAKQSQIFPR